MISKIKRFLVISSAFSSLLALVAAPALVYAAGTSSVNTNVTSGLCTGVDAGVGGNGGATGGLSLNGSTNSGDTNCTSDQSAGTTLGHILSEVINIMSILVGVICVIMIIVGGLKYVTSGGESNNVSGAKNTIMYALIGLVVVAMAQIIVHFVLSRLSTS
jgi:hypothetical protein